MFDHKVYQSRRAQLKKLVSSGQVLLLGNQEAPKNYKDNWYPYRQDSTFLYYTGITRPGVHLLIDVDQDNDTLYGDELTIDDIIWTGSMPSLKELAESAGISRTAPLNTLYGQKLRTAMFLPPYRGEHSILLSRLTGHALVEIESTVHSKLIHAVIKQRNHKSEEEIEQMDHAVDISYRMHEAAIRSTVSGIKESNLVGKGYDVAYEHEVALAYPAILTTRGEVLHNHDHHRTLRDGQMILCDMGGESKLHYAGDITRTWPISGKWTSIQKDIYHIVYAAYKNAVTALKPGVPFKDIHLIACKTITSGLVDIGWMKGNPEDAVRDGAHTVFFPHGLGHMIGLDVHDMENLGEDLVGYTDQIKRDTSFGFRSLRLGRHLEEGHALTIEPGIYVIPQLLTLRDNQGLHKDFINYDKLSTFSQFGGIRLEDNYVLQKDGAKRIGTTHLDLSPEHIESLVGAMK